MRGSVCPSKGRLPGVPPGPRIRFSAARCSMSRATPASTATDRAGSAGAAPKRTEGRARFTVGDKTIDAEAGDVILGPANIPHGYQNLGPGRLESLDIHLSPAAELKVDIVVGGPYSSGVLVGGDRFEYKKASPEILAKVARIKALADRYLI